jgi:hypothetical protein
LGAACHQFSTEGLGRNRKVDPLSLFRANQHCLMAKRTHDPSERCSHRQSCMITGKYDTHEGISKVAR